MEHIDCIGASWAVLLDTVAQWWWAFCLTRVQRRGIVDACVDVRGGNPVHLKLSILKILLEAGDVAKMSG